MAPKETLNLSLHYDYNARRTNPDINTASKRDGAENRVKLWSCHGAVHIFFIRNCLYKRNSTLDPKKSRNSITGKKLKKLFTWAKEFLRIFLLYFLFFHVSHHYEGSQEMSIRKAPKTCFEMFTREQLVNLKTVIFSQGTPIAQYLMIFIKNVAMLAQILSY